MVTLRVKAKSGQVMEVTYEALLAIDGTPYKVTNDELREALIHFGGRLEAVENFISGLLRTEQSEHKDG